MNNYVIIGSGSEISQSFQNLLYEKDQTFFTISRTKNINQNHLVVDDYLRDRDKILEFINEIINPTIIFFNGFLAENRGTYSPKLNEIEITDYVNFQIPYFLSKEISNQINAKKFIYISSIASVRPRYKNYIYGLSKNKLEKSIRFLNLSSYLIIRFGKVETKMSKDHKTAPFTVSCDRAAKIIMHKINKKGVVHANLGIYFSRILLKILPQKIVDRF
tara:strand:- start:28929 stop:29582 length:654 start_codon:yes stop_codon:yes gene_type:complete